MNRAPTSIFIPPIRREGVQSGLGIDYEDSEYEHGDTNANTDNDTNTDSDNDTDNDADNYTDNDTDNEEDVDIFNSDDEEDDDKRKTLQKIKVGETVINLITEVILPYLNELK